jgi:hypothetical protein
MSIAFSDTVNNTGIVQQVRDLMRVDATQWPTSRIVNSVNNYLDLVTGYAIGADRRFQWDDTNHTKLPEGTTDLTINVSDYSFLTDEQGNSIITLTGISRLESGSNYEPLYLIDRNDSDYDAANFGIVSGTPTCYDKIADNIIRLDTKPPATVSAGLKFFFQRTPSYFAATDTTKAPGVSPLLHRGFVIAAAYDGAMTLGLPNLQPLSVERQMEEKKMIQYFSDRNKDDNQMMTMKSISFR